MAVLVCLGAAIVGREEPSEVVSKHAESSPAYIGAASPEPASKEIISPCAHRCIGNLLANIKQAARTGNMPDPVPSDLSVSSLSPTQIDEVAVILTDSVKHGHPLTDSPVAGLLSAFSDAVTVQLAERLYESAHADVRRIAIDVISGSLTTTEQLAHISQWLQYETTSDVVSVMVSQLITLDVRSLSDELQVTLSQLATESTYSPALRSQALAALSIHAPLSPSTELAIFNAANASDDDSNLAAIRAMQEIVQRNRNTYSYTYHKWLYELAHEAEHTERVREAAAQALLFMSDKEGQPPAPG